MKHGGELTKLRLKGPQGRYPTYVCLVLLFAYTVAFADRQILGLLVHPIKRDLGISDAQFGLLAGFVFALFYTGFGLVMGRIADRWHRRNLILFGMLIWIPSTAMAGLANSFTMLVVSRILVAVGEATLNPAAYSLLSDYFPREQRARAISVYTSGVYIGSAMAFILGGLVVANTNTSGTIEFPILGSIAPWRYAFIAVALPGVLAFGLMLTVREPVRHESSSSGMLLIDPRSSRLRLRFYLPGMLGFGITAIVTYCFAIWLPASFARSFGWTAADFGPVYGGIILICGVGGMLAAGFAADSMEKRKQTDGALLLIIGATMTIGPFAATFAFTQSPMLAIGAVAAITFLLGIAIALTPTVLISVTPNRLRGQVSSAAMVVINLVGLGAGPSMVTLLNDRAFQDEAMIKTSLGIVGALASALAAAFLLGSLPRFRALMKLTESAV